MRRFISIVLAVGMIVGIAYAGIEQFDVENKMKGYVKNIYSVSTSSAISIGNVLQDAKDLVASYGSLLEATDKAKLNSLETKVNTAKTALDDIKGYIETNWPAISE